MAEAHGSLGALLATAESVWLIQSALPFEVSNRVLESSSAVIPDEFKISNGSARCSPRFRKGVVVWVRGEPPRLPSCVLAGNTERGALSRRQTGYAGYAGPRPRAPGREAIAHCTAVGWLGRRLGWLPTRWGRAAGGRPTLSANMTNK